MLNNIYMTTIIIILISQLLTTLLTFFSKKGDNKLTANPWIYLNSLVNGALAILLGYMLGFLADSYLVDASLSKFTILGSILILSLTSLLLHVLFEKT